ncbi:protein adenylyltransferase SelO [Flavobacterium sp.]|uniref:protein adenylyltransferase SelO n=1 Tax=Flavobacterium sp. TaxID=239 RepID=UPI003D6C030D
MNFTIKNRFTSELPADIDESNVSRQVHNACFSYVTPRIPSNPKLIHASTETAELIGLTGKEVQSEEFTAVFSGKKILEGTNPFAMCYAGHQFGNWAGQLGDGRAINLTEIEYQNQSYTLQLKGAGKTPYSRNADGLAVLRSSIREHLCSEAMHYLGIPTTRSLSLILTGDEVLRDVMYNGNPAYEKGAVVCRVAPSFIRFGSFEIFASRNDIKNLQLLTDFTIKQYYPEIASEGKDKYLEFFKTVADSTRKMILDWQRVGFVHGVMNTDNMSIHGITIDYGPYGWLEDFNTDWTPNTTDIQHKRYRYGNQPEIALWNLYQLANALYPLIEETSGLEEILNSYANLFERGYSEMMRNKIGIELHNIEDTAIIEQLTQNLQLSETDMTLFFRNLSLVTKDDTPEKAMLKIHDAFYKPSEIKDRILDTWVYWFTKYINRLNKEMVSDDVRKTKMDAVNPKYVLRNYMAQLAIEAAEKEDYSLLNEIHVLLKKPYDHQPEFEKWFVKRPDWAREKVGSSMLSCSS